MSVNVYKFHVTLFKTICIYGNLGISISSITYIRSGATYPYTTKSPDEYLRQGGWKRQRGQGSVGN